MAENIGKPLGDKVLLKLEDTSDKKSSGGIILNQSTQTVIEAVVIAVSDGYPSPTGEKIKLGGVTYNLVRDSDLLIKL
jgi:co-chaperonin GroES (HSP10)